MTGHATPSPQTNLLGFTPPPPPHRFLDTKVPQTVEIFFRHEAAEFSAALSGYLGSHPSVDKWIAELTNRMAQPVRRAHLFMNIDVPALASCVAHASKVLAGVNIEEMEHDLKARGSLASELERAAPRLLRERLSALTCAEERLREGESIAKRCDAFLGNLSIRAEDLERSVPQRGKKIKPGFFVQHEYHRLALLKGSLPPHEELSRESVANLLGGDFSWVLRRYTAEQSLRADLVRFHKHYSDGPSGHHFRDVEAVVEFPQPLGPETISCDKLVTDFLAGQVSSSQLAALNQAVETFFLAKADKVLRVKSS